MSLLDVPGAQLYYETRGDGPVMVLVPGASGSGDAFRGVAEHLAADYSVITYDRRGFSRSHLDGLQDYTRRLETEADDVRRLIEHVSDQPATLFGASSGGIIVLEVLTRYPAVVRTLVPFEPPVVTLMADGEEWLEFFSDLYQLYRETGIGPAMERFRERAFIESDRHVLARAMDPTNPAAIPNATYWFEHELRQYPAAQLQIDLLRAHAQRVIPAVGRQSEGTPAHAATLRLAELLDRRILELPGGHLGCVSNPSEFARELGHALAEQALRGAE